MSTEWHGGKGSEPRPIDFETYRNNFEQIEKIPKCEVCNNVLRMTKDCDGNWICVDHPEGISKIP